MKLLKFISLIAIGLSSAAHAERLHGPLQVAANGRYLEWSHGEPFFIHADTAWTLPSEYEPEEVSKYLDRCVEDGFNTIQLSALFPQKGIPFLQQGFKDQDLSKPDPFYWANVDWVVNEITKRGLVASLNPFWKKGTDQVLLKNGAKKCRNFGQWFAQRYVENPQVIYFIGGDQGPDKASAELSALAEGIQKVCKGKAILAYHNGSDRTSLDAYPEKPDWLTLNWTYAYSPDYRKEFPYQQNLENYKNADGLPIHFGEGYYSSLPPRHFKGKAHGVNDRWASRFAVRRQAWWAGFLTGSTGYAYGADPIWAHQYDEKTWEDALEFESRADMVHLINFVNQLDWWKFIPDLERTFLTGGYGEWLAYDYAVAAVSSDQTAAVIYTPKHTHFELDLSRLATGEITAQWFDPSSGTYEIIPTKTLNAKSRVKLLSPPQNAAGDSDFVLLITVEKF